MTVKRVLGFVERALTETLWAIMFLFATLIPFMYMMSQLSGSRNVFVEALAAILLRAWGSQAAAVLADPVAVRTTYIGHALGFAVLAMIFRALPIAMNWRSTSSSEDKLDEYIDRLPRKRREALCSALLQVVDKVEDLQRQADAPQSVIPGEAR